MKTYVLMLAATFPTFHQRAGMETPFYKIVPTYKIHTIRANYDLWKKRFEIIEAGLACISVRQWVGKPYGKGATQRELMRLTREDGIGLQKVQLFEREPYGVVYRDDNHYKTVSLSELAANDGLSLDDWLDWFEEDAISKPMAIIHFSKFRY